MHLELAVDELKRIGLVRYDLAIAVFRQRVVAVLGERLGHQLDLARRRGEARPRVFVVRELARPEARLLQRVEVGRQVLDDPPPPLLPRIPLEQVPVAHLLRESADDVVHGSRLVVRSESGHADDRLRGHGQALADLRALVEGGLRQHELALGRRLAEIGVDRDGELERLHRLAVQGRVRLAHDRVRALEEERLDGIGRAFQDGLRQQLRRQVRRQRIAHRDVERRLAGLRLARLGDAERRLQRRPVLEDQVARPVHLPRQGVEDVDHPRRVEPVGVVAEPLEGLEHRRPCRRELARQPADRVRRHVGDPRRPLRGIAPRDHVATELVEAVRPLTAERLVVELVLHDHVGHGEEQRAVRPRRDRDPLARLLRGRREGGIDHDEARPLGDGGQEASALEEILVCAQHVDAE